MPTASTTYMRESAGPGSISHGAVDTQTVSGSANSSSTGDWG
ncbi:MAG: hypothetical protein M5U09_20990 [Gammaproteobacteria bacterium]|nr:hypothetical protein [Gammaproteobacteria bacterium]